MSTTDSDRRAASDSTFTPMPWQEWYAAAEDTAGHHLDGDEVTDGYSVEAAYDAWLTGSTPTGYVRSLEAEGRAPMKNRGPIVVLLAAVLILIVIKLAVHTALALAGLPQIPLVDGTVALVLFLLAGAVFAWIDATA
ncbi:hypothetical protein ASF48_05125 [Rathayibacter sp. Leaf299]|uniref:hypothetical protein n=1 Tax=Rathayibacter sp. Leaf299 TaxID=1736328 RepID=UPI0006F483C1|nr:hypothetical protein [Rathayibacter sp. Leaf299]KQQ22568.1 hypothetical protein ASF48_05125 [Rathayibacter sp. Leaf299]